MGFGGEAGWDNIWESAISSPPVPSTNSSPTCQPCIPRPKPHGWQTGRTMGFDWARGRVYNQMGVRFGSGQLTWPGSFRSRSSRGRSLELRLRGAAGPPSASTSTSLNSSTLLDLLSARPRHLVACRSSRRHGSKAVDPNPRRRVWWRIGVGQCLGSFWA